jgi:hypothetical protein
MQQRAKELGIAQKFGKDWGKPNIIFQVYKNHGQIVSGKRCFQKILVLVLWHGRTQAEHVGVVR